MVNPYESYVYRYCDLLKCFHLILKDEVKNNPAEYIVYLKDLVKLMCEKLTNVEILENRKIIESKVFQFMSYCQGSMNTIYYSRISNNHKCMMAFKDEVLIKGQPFVDTSQQLVTGQLPVANKGEIELLPMEN